MNKSAPSSLYLNGSGVLVFWRILRSTIQSFSIRFEPIPESTATIPSKHPGPPYSYPASSSQPPPHSSPHSPLSSRTQRQQCGYFHRRFLPRGPFATDIITAYRGRECGRAPSSASAPAATRALHPASKPAGRETFTRTFFAQEVGIRARVGGSVAGAARWITGVWLRTSRRGGRFGCGRMCCIRGESWGTIQGCGGRVGRVCGCRGECDGWAGGRQGGGILLLRRCWRRR